MEGWNAVVATPGSGQPTGDGGAADPSGDAGAPDPSGVRGARDLSGDRGTPDLSGDRGAPYLPAEAAARSAADAAQRHFDAVVAEQLDEDDVELRRALRRQNLAVHGKVFAFLQDGHLVVKLPAARCAAMAAAGEARMLRSGNRTMREWITVDPPATAADDTWRRLAHDSRRYVDPGSVSSG